MSLPEGEKLGNIIFMYSFRVPHRDGQRDGQTDMVKQYRPLHAVQADVPEMGRIS